MDTIMHKHILIMEVEILGNESDKEHFQTTMRVLNEMSYEAYSGMIKSVNLANQIKNLMKENLE